MKKEERRKQKKETKRKKKKRNKNKTPKRKQISKLNLFFCRNLLGK